MNIYLTTPEKELSEHKIIAEITKKKFINKATENLKPCMYEKYPIDGFCHGVKVED